MPIALRPAPARTLLLWLVRACAARPPGPRNLRPGALPHLTDRAARDIGLSRAETELLRHRWPSAHGPRHAML